VALPHVPLHRHVGLPTASELPDVLGRSEWHRVTAWRQESLPTQHGQATGDSKRARLTARGTAGTFETRCRQRGLLHLRQDACGEAGNFVNSNGIFVNEAGPERVPPMSCEIATRWVALLT